MVTTPFLTLLLFHLSNAQSQKTTIWTETFTYNVDSTACQCQKWIDFWQFWIGDPSQVVSITLGGSLTSTTYKCSGSAAQFVAFALATPPYETTQVTCESGLIWYTGHAAAFGQAAVGVSTLTTVCSSDPAIRPCWSLKGWGGIGSYTCTPPTQTLKVTVVSNIPTANVPPASVTWTDSFSYSVPATSAQCSNWQQFWQNTVPRSGTLSVTLMSSINGSVSATCSGPGVNLFATALFTATSSGQYHCNEGTVWYFTGIYGAYPNTSAIQIGGIPSSCSAALSLRPCWNQPMTADWGGFGGVNCRAASQAFSATVTIGTNTITNVCWQQVNVANTTGTFTVSCSTIMLQCNTNYTASGYGTSSVGAYYCTSGVWCPTVPTCNVAGTTSTTTTTTITTASTTPCITTTTSSTTSSTKSSTTATSTTKSTTSSSTSPSRSTSTTSSSTVRPTTTVSSTTTFSTSSSTIQSPATTTPTTSTTTSSISTTTSLTPTTIASSTSINYISGSTITTTYDSASVSSFASGTINTSPSGSTKPPLKVQPTSIGHSNMVWLLAAPLLAAIMVIGGFCAFLVFGTKMKRHMNHGTTQTSAEL